MSIKSRLRQVKQRRRILFCLIVAIIFSSCCYQASQHLFESYYSENWGMSAIGFHSPPYGTNYPNKARIVGLWSIGLSFPLGFGVARLFTRIKTSK